MNKVLARSLATLVRDRPARVAKDFDRQLEEACHHLREMGPGRVLLQQDEASGVATVTLDNSGRKNALSGRMMTQLLDVVRQLETWTQAKAVVIRGSGHFFCSGGDLNTVRQIADPVNGRKMSLLMHHVLTRLQSLPLLSLAAIQGMAIGGGAEICSACDFRLVADTARIGFVHVRVGIVSAWGGGARLSQLVGQQRALDLMLSGRVVQQEEAIAIGLADGALRPGDAAEAAADWLEEKYELRSKSPELIHALKKVLVGAKFLPLELALNEEVEASVGVWGAPDHLNRLSANVKHN